MGNFCTNEEKDEQPTIQHECHNNHYSQKPLKVIKEPTYTDVESISLVHHRVERCRRLDKVVVVKRINKNIFLMQEQLEMEKQVLLNVRFPFICKLIQYKDLQECFLFELENCLYDLQNRQLTQEQLLFVIASIVLAIKEIHKMGYVYRALHLSHILIAEDGYIRLIGFGHSSNTSNCPIIASYDELRIFPPETVHGKFDQCGDWWSLGALIHKVLYGSYPHENEDKNFELIKNLNPRNRIALTNELTTLIGGEEESPEHIGTSIFCDNQLQIVERQKNDISIYQLIMNDAQNAYPMQEEQPPQIEESTIPQATPVIQQDNNNSRPLDQASGEERRLFMIQSMRALFFQQLLQILLTIGFSYIEEWGFCGNLFLFISFTITLHIYLAVHKTRGYQKEQNVMRLQYIIWSFSYSVMVTLLATLLSVLYFGWYYYLPFFVSSFLFPTITLIIVIQLQTGNGALSVKQYTLLFFVGMFFIDLTISLFDEGFLHFGYLIGELISYLYGLYLTHINLQIQYPVSDLSLNIEQETTKFDQALNLVNKGVESFEIGTVNTEKQITVEQIKSEHGIRRLLKLGLFACFGIVFAIFPWMYIVLGILLLVIVFKADTKFVQFGKKTQVCLDEQFIAPILINLDILGGLKYVIE